MARALYVASFFAITGKSTYSIPSLIANAEKPKKANAPMIRKMMSHFLFSSLGMKNSNAPASSPIAKENTGVNKVNKIPNQLSYLPKAVVIC